MQAKGTAGSRSLEGKASTLSLWCPELALTSVQTTELSPGPEWNGSQQRWALPTLPTPHSPRNQRKCSWLRVTHNTVTRHASSTCQSSCKDATLN